MCRLDLKTCALAGLFAVAAAPPSFASPDSDARLLEYIAWITAHSDYEYHGEPLPGIVRYPHATLVAILYAGAAVDGDHQVYAIYDHTADDILIPETFDLDAPESQPILLHEMVHYLQDLAGMQDASDCLAELEPPAYRLHAAFAEERGFQHDDSGLFDAMMALMACQDEGMGFGTGAR